MIELGLSEEARRIVNVGNFELRSENPFLQKIIDRIDADFRRNGHRCETWSYPGHGLILFVRDETHFYLASMGHHWNGCQFEGLSSCEYQTRCDEVWKGLLKYAGEFFNKQGRVIAEGEFRKSLREYIASDINPELFLN